MSRAGEPILCRAWAARDALVRTASAAWRMLRLFIKKTQKTPQAEVEIALKRLIEADGNGSRPFQQGSRTHDGDSEFSKEYEALGEEFALTEAKIGVPTPANMTQADVAKAMGVSQPRVVRIFSGKNVALETLRRYAKATGGRFKIIIEPGKADTC